MDLPAADPRLAAALSALLGPAQVGAGRAERLACARDLWPLATHRARHGRLPALPEAVVWPRDPEEVARLVRWARERGVPLVPYGGGSGVCGGTTPVPGGVIVDLKRLDRLRAIDGHSEIACAEAGINGAHLEAALNAAGYTLGHFPSSIMCSTLGGWIAARSAGQMSTKYGNIEDLTLALEAVLPDGTRWQSRLVPRSAAGPDLARLLIGAEGTLGIVTAAHLQLRRLPAARRFRAFLFPAVERALDAVRETLQQGALPAAVRVYDALDTRLNRLHRPVGGEAVPSSEFGVPSAHTSDLSTQSSALSTQHSALPGWLAGLRAHLRAALPVAWAERLALQYPRLINRAAERLGGPALLVLVFEGDEGLTAAEEAMAAACAVACEGRDQGAAPARDWFDRRYDVSFKMPRVFAAGGYAETLEVAATWTNLLPLYRGMKTALAEHAVVMSHFSHAYRSGCNIYFTFAGAGADPDDTEQRYHAAVRAALDACLAAGGTIAHHHGVGVAKARFAAADQGAGWALWRALKRGLDPGDLLNPGKLLPPEHTAAGGLDAAAVRAAPRERE